MSEDVKSLIACAKETREACAAMMRVISKTPEDPMIVDRLDLELHLAGVKNGFGVRLQDAIAATEASVPLPPAPEEKP